MNVWMGTDSPKYSFWYSSSSAAYFIIINKIEKIISNPRRAISEGKIAWIVFQIVW